MRGGGRAERRRGEARAERAGKRADDVEIGSDTVREYGVRNVEVVVVALRPAGASRALGCDGFARGRRGEALDDREGGANVQVTTAGVARVVSGRDDGEPRGGGEDQREGQRQGAMEIRGGGGGLWAARSVGERGVAVVARVVVIVGRVVGRVPAATTTRGQRRRRRRGERGEQGCERHGAERITRRGPGRAGQRVDGRTRVARGVHELAHVHRTSAIPSAESDAPEGLNPTPAQSDEARSVVVVTY